MKIFNWVHRRFTPKDGLDQNHVKKDEEILSNNDHADTATLLEKVIVPTRDMLHEFHGWGAEAGILSIGTFGLGDNFGTDDERSKEYLGLMPKDEYMQLEDDDEYSQSRHVENDDDEIDDNSSDGEDREEEWNPLVCDKSGAPRSVAIIINNINLDASKLLLQIQDYSISELDNNVFKTYKKEKERITLADLFSADSDDGLGTIKNPKNYCKTTRGRPPSPRGPEYCSKKTSSTTLPTPDRAAKNGTLFPKKLIPRLKQDSRSIRKLNGFMRRMLKRKIHPDVAEGKIKPCVAGNGSVNESVSLLQCQDQSCCCCCSSRKIINKKTHRLSGHSFSYWKRWQIPKFMSLRRWQSTTKKGMSGLLSLGRERCHY